MRWGKLVAIKYLGNKKWLCQCDCGNTTVVSSDHLRTNKKNSTQSCGCNLKSKLVGNIDYFNVIDSENKAYFLGLIASDGSITANGNYYLRLVLQEQDFKILEVLKEDLKSKVEIKYFNSTSKLPQGTYCNSNFCSILVCSKQIVNDLIKYGITPKKSLTLKFNYDLLPNIYLKDFLRGLWDGDGSFSYLEKRKLLEVNLTTSLDMAIVTKNKILEIFPDFHIKIYPMSNEKTVRFVFTKQEDSKKFLDFLYLNDNIHLDRKYNKFLKIRSLIY